MHTSAFTGIDTQSMHPQVAARITLQQDAQQQQLDLGSLTGPQAYQPFMSPYQQEVMDTTLQSLIETKQFKTQV